MVVFYYILWTLSLALKLSILRLVEFVFYAPHSSGWKEAFQILITGFRFDLMVVGFWQAPVVIFLIISMLISGQGFVKPAWAKIYLVVTWLFICALYFKDLVSYPATQNRLWLADHLEHPILNWKHADQLQWWSWVVIVLLSLGLFQAGARRFETFILRFHQVGFFSVAFIFLWTVLISRGTLTEHHLRRKDCQFARDYRMEALCLNPVFTFSKNK